jgi:tetratricopeptide (TPR) repeat protein
LAQMEPTAAQLAEARRCNDPEMLASALTAHANSLIQHGKIDSARAMLDEAAEINHSLGKGYDEARCTHLAATLCRMEGNLAEALKRVKKAEALATPGSPVAVSVATEYAEIALTQKDGSRAAAAYRRAFEEGQIAGLTDTAKASLLRKRANALAMSNRFKEAAQDLESAYLLLQQAGDKTNAVRTLIEKATTLHQGGDREGVNDALHNAFREARACQDDHALADLQLLEATIALEQQNLSAALAAAEAAREHALAAIAPLSYVSAAVAIADINEASSNHLAAYASLASGWATVSDLLGQEAARSLFETKMLTLRKAWGGEKFARVKETYEIQRRAAMQ